MSSPRVVVFGSTGVIGSLLVQVIAEKQPTWKIEAVSRSPGSSRFASLSNVKMVQGDAEDRDRMIEICSGAHTVYVAIGFPKYETKYWAEHWPIVMGNIIGASSSTRLVFCDNLYAYGPGTNVSTSSTLVKPGLGSKPAIRALIREKLQERMDIKPKSIVVVGGADFFGPNVTTLGVLGDTFFGHIAKKKSPYALGSADKVHDFCYVKDFASALYLASVRLDSYGRFWICPHTIKNKTMKDIAKDAAALIEGSKAKVTVLPTWVISCLGLIDHIFADGFMHEMKEMMGWWVDDYTVDDSDFVKKFGVPATPYDEALADTVEFYQDREIAEK
mmetsp:Transcript_22406/g.33163  ORF Transcript_22406/g.33163 Transcript_22406/m.33163 type:complete len:331 (-) Transcript_22406:179-1171(-)